MKRTLLLSVVALAACAVADGAVINATPGSVEAELKNIPADDTEITVTGSIDVRDLRALAAHPGLTDLDLSGSAIVSYSADEADVFGQYFFEADRIPQYAFFGSSITKISFPTNLVKIGEGAFAGTGITDLRFPSTLRELGRYAFHGCKSLVTIYYSSGLRNLGTGVFAGCSSLRSGDLHNSKLAALPEKTFSGCSSLRSVNFPGTLSTLGSHVFEGTAIDRLNVSQIRDFGPYALAGMEDLLEVTLTPYASYGPGLLMDDDRLQIIDNAPEEIPVLFAANCYDLDIDNPVSNAWTFEDYAFANTSSWYMTASPWLSYIGPGAFRNLKYLNTFDMRLLGDAVPEVDPTAFDGIDVSKVTLYVEEHMEDPWRDHPVWSLFDVRSDTNTNVDSFGKVPVSFVRYRDGILEARSLDPMLSIEAYGIGGELLLKAEPGDVFFEAEVTTDSPVIVVKTTTAAGSQTTKLLAR